MKYDLSILIPSRNEQWISNTVDDLLKNKRGKTQIIVGLDGEWAEPGIVDHPDVTVVYASESIGQRALTNRLCLLSSAKYIAKCDAHCAFDEGFDVKLMDAMKGHDDWTVVPIMRNLHAWDWKCQDCGNRTYQGPTPGTKSSKFSSCEKCGSMMFNQKLVWNPKPSPQSTSYCFDPEPHFQYFNEFKKRPEGQGDITPTMSLQGSFFMLTREKYWELDICSEDFGSWGSQGIEVACKTWLSGGQVMCIQSTWYAHMFRTQGGDFSFPYQQHQSNVETAKAHARTLFFDGNWDKQIHPVSWLVEKFWPVHGWSQADLTALKEKEAVKPLAVTGTKGIIYYTDNQLPLRIAKPVQQQLLTIAKQKDLPIVSSSLKPMSNMGINVVVQGQRGYLTMFKQILAALEASQSDIIFFCEHDVLYPKEHFNFTPPDKNKFYYDINWYKVREDGYAVHWDAQQVSGLCCYREAALAWYRNRVATFDPDNFDRKFEPMSEAGAVSWKASVPHIDIRHRRNLTYNKWTLDHFRKKDTAVNFEISTVDKIPGWDNLSAIIRQ